jgi:hypothetical protein
LFDSGLGNYGQAQEYLSQAEWTVKKNPDCPQSILSRVHRNIAMLQMAKGESNEALRNLANDVRLLVGFRLARLQIISNFRLPRYIMRQKNMELMTSAFPEAIFSWPTFFSNKEEWKLPIHFIERYICTYHRPWDLTIALNTDI